MKGAAQYDDAAKDAWRGWKWNTIAAALMNWRELGPAERARQLSTKTVLYLVGPDDHDRKRAMARGFRNENLIAVDLVQERIDEVRAAGGFGIRGSLQQLLMNWPADWPIDVVDADLCSGITKDVDATTIVLLASCAIHKDTIISINLMRGRDSRSNIFRESLRRQPGGISIRGMHRCGDLNKHRGYVWMQTLIHYWNIVNMRSFVNDRGNTETAMFREEIQRLVNEAIVPELNSYKSKTSGQYFDSIVHRFAMHSVCTKSKKIMHEYAASFMDAYLSKRTCSSDGILHRIAALRAVRTMKLRELQAS